MKDLQVLLLFFVEFILLSCFIGFIWYLCDNGMPLQHTVYIGKMFSVLLVVLGFAGPVTFGVLVGHKIDQLIK